ncbi:MAG: SemiSWEET family transporter [Candidatus Paceibacterota bacterium]|jgi:uncharacterized protein with PQ loop repeat
MNKTYINKIGWFASLMAVLMFSSYIDQIRLNLSGNKGSIILPIATTVNCISWSAYAMLKEKKDWPLFVCNAIGIVFGVITAITALV